MRLLLIGLALASFLVAGLAPVQAAQAPVLIVNNVTIEDTPHDHLVYIGVYVQNGDGPNPPTSGGLTLETTTGTLPYQPSSLLIDSNTLTTLTGQAMFIIPLNEWPTTLLYNDGLQTVSVSLEPFV